MDGQIHGWMDKRVDVWQMDRYIDTGTWMDGQIDGYRYTDGWMNEQIDRYIYKQRDNG